MIDIKTGDLGRGTASLYIGVTLRNGMTLGNLLVELHEIESKHPSREIRVGAIDKEHIFFIVGKGSPCGT